MRQFILLFTVFLTACAPTVIQEAPEAEGDDPGECADDADNDQDGLFDCNDDDCAGAAACADDDDSAVADDDDSGGDDDDCADTGGILIGDITFGTEEAMEEFCARYAIVYGSVQVGPFSGSTLKALSCLEEVHGNLVLTSETLLSAVLPGLRFVGGLVVVSTDVATIVSFPVLTEVGGSFAVDHSGALEITSAPHLERTGASFAIAENPALTTLDFTDLAEVGGNFTIRGNPMLPTSHAEALLGAVGAENVEGVIDISSNGPG